MRVHNFDARRDMESLVATSEQILCLFHIPPTLPASAILYKTSAEHLMLSIGFQLPPPPSAAASTLFRRFSQQRRSLICGTTDQGPAVALNKEPFFIPAQEDNARLICCYLEDMLTFGGPYALSQEQRLYVNHVLRSINA